MPEDKVSDNYQLAGVNGAKKKHLHSGLNAYFDKIKVA